MTRFRSLIALTATTAALAACAAPTDDDDADGADGAISATLALGGGCAFADGARGQLTVEFIRRDRVRVVQYDSAGREKFAAAEYPVKAGPNNSLAAYGTSTNGRKLFTLSKRGSSYEIKFEADTFIPTWASYRSTVACSLTAPAKVPPLPNALAPAAPKNVPATHAFALSSLPARCSATKRNAVGDVVELDFDLGSDESTVYVSVRRYRSDGHVRSGQIVNAVVTSAGGLELQRSYSDSDARYAEQYVIPIGDLRATATGGTQHELTLVANHAKYPSGPYSSSGVDQSLADAVGDEPIAMACD